VRQLHCSGVSGLPLSAASLFLFLSLALPLVAQSPVAHMPGEPALASIFPIGVQRGAAAQVEIRGYGLEGAYAVWFVAEGVKAQVESVEEVKPAETKKKEDKKVPVEYRVVARVEASPGSLLGAHPLRLVSSRGVSNPVLLHVFDESAITEVKTPHQSAREAQKIAFPVVVHGRIGTGGQVDFYELDVSKPERVSFELTTSREAATVRFRPQLALYEVKGSWFDANRPVRVAFTDQMDGEMVVVATDPRERSGTRLSLQHRFPKAGRYFLEVGSLFGKGGPDHVYQLRIVPGDPATDGRHQTSDWQERSFARRLEADWLRSLWGRTVKKDTSAVGQHPNSDSAGLASGGLERTSTPVPLPDRASATEFATLEEKEPNEEPPQALEISIPALVEGVIERPNDVDVFRFKASRGQRLAFEVETPEATTPRFNPLLTIVDSNGTEVLTNIQRAPEYKSVTSYYLRSLNAKVINTFEQEGDYWLRIRDITSRNGGAGFRYRVLVRQQIPHVGEIEVQTRTRGLEDGKADPARLNLVAGEAKKLTLAVDHEEGFFNPANVISIVPEGLPEGVSAFAASSSYSLESRVREEPVFKEESFLPRKQNVTLVFQARADAPLTRMPATVQIVAHAIVDGKPSSRLTVKAIPMMVVRPPEAAGLNQARR